MGDEALESVVTACRALAANSQHPGVKADFVVEHDDTLGRYLVKARRLTDGNAAAVHKRSRLHQQHALAADGALADHGVELHTVDLDATALCDAVYGEKACVVPGLLVFTSHVAEADDNVAHRALGL